MADLEPSEKEEDKFLECSICVFEYKEPKRLPCWHTFCLDCLKQLCSRADGDLIPCPICKQEFSLTPDGLDKLPGNDLIARLLLQNAQQKGKKSHSMCEQCSNIGEETEALSFCMDCRQNMCSRCNNLHINISGTKLHKVVPIEAKPTEFELARLKSSSCPVHTNKEIELYCCDCRVLVCVLCHATDHNKHFCKVPRDVAKEMKTISENYTQSLRKCRSETNDKIEKLKMENRKLERLLTLTKSTKAIDDSNVDGNVADVKQEIANIRRNLKENESQLEFQEHRCTALNSFVDYNRRVIERGTDCEIIRTAEDLHKRAEELLSFYQKEKQQQQQHQQQQKTNAYNTSEQLQLELAKPLIPAAADIQKLLGIVVPKCNFGRMNLNSDSTVNIIQNSKPIRGVALVHNEIFVVRHQQSQIDVYDVYTLVCHRHINIPDMTSPEDLAGCSYNKALYISNQSLRLNCIHRVDLYINSVTHWEMRANQVPCGLSVTAKHTLLVTVHIRGTGGESGVVEYTNEGQMIREIRFDRSIKEAHQTIQPSSDQFVVCQGSYGSTLHRICMINTEGQIIKVYGKEEGSGKGQLNYPSSLSLYTSSKYKMIYVADCVNHRVILLNHDLSYLGQVNSTHNLNRPYRLYFDPSSHLLLIGEFSGRLLFSRLPA